jgi:hypothetical protein
LFDEEEPEQGALFSKGEPGAEKPPASLPKLLAGARAQRVARTGAQLADTLRINAHAADVLQQAYERGGGKGRLGSFDGAAAYPEHVLPMLKGLKGGGSQAGRAGPASGGQAGG